MFWSLLLLIKSVMDVLWKSRLEGGVPKTLFLEEIRWNVQSATVI